MPEASQETCQTDTTPDLHPEVPLRMPQGSMASDAARRSQLRFHLRGLGPTDDGGSPAPELETLRPVVLRALEPAVGSGGKAGPEDPIALYARHLVEPRRQRRRALRAEVETLAASLAGRLRRDGPRDLDEAGEHLGFELGGIPFLDAMALARELPAGQVGASLESGRRERLREVLAVLRRHLDGGEAEEIEGVVLTRHGGRSFAVPGLRVVEHDEPLVAALGIFDAQAAELADLLRAVRIARLELAAAYREDLHDEAFADFDWQAMEREEIGLLPPLLVEETAEGLHRGALAPFSRLLASGRPIHVLVREEEAGLGSWSDPGGFHPGFAQLAVAHREVFVFQGTLARPTELALGFEAMDRAVVPAVAVVAVGGESVETEGDDGPWILLLAAEAGHATPNFRYDPEAGETLAERFTLGDDPQSVESWPCLAMAYLDAAGNEQRLDLAATLADAAVLCEDWHHHLRPLAADAWCDEQFPLHRWLELTTAEREQSLPYLWCADPEGTLVRVLITRELAWATRDRLRAWRDLRALAGVEIRRGAGAPDAGPSGPDEAEIVPEPRDTPSETEPDALRRQATADAVQRMLTGLLKMAR